MKSLILFVCIIATTFTNVIVAQTCTPVAPVCPSGVVETAPTGTLPTICSGKGQCLFGACKCFAGFGDVDCSAVLRKTKLASVFLTQGGLDDGPTRYFDIITQLVEILRTQGGFAIPPQDIINNCGLAQLRTPPVPLLNISMALVENSISVQILNGGISTTGTAHMVIPKVPLNAAFIKPIPFTNPNCCDAKGQPLQTSTSTCSVQCSADKGDFVAFEMDATLTIQIFPKFDPVTGNVTITIPDDAITVTFNPPDMGFKLSCDLGSFANNIVEFINKFVISFGKIVAGQVLVQVRQLAGEFANKFSLAGTTLNVTQDISAQAFVPFMEFVQGSHIAMNVEGFIRKKRFVGQSGCPDVVTTFVDRTIDGNALGLPVALQDAFWQDDDNRLLQTLFGMRLARSAMTVGTQALFLDHVEIIQALTNIRTHFGLLDAHFDAALDLSLPTFGFPAKSIRSQLGNGDFLEAGLSAGDASVACNETGKALFSSNFGQAAINLRPLFIADLKDYQAVAQGRPSDANFRVTMQVFDVDVGGINLQMSAPINVSLPNAITVAATNILVGGPKMAAANALLQKLAISLPPEISNLIPGPRVESLHNADVPGTDGKNGFFQVSTRCLCQNGGGAPAKGLDTQFFVVNSKKFGDEIVPLCQKQCPTSVAKKDTQAEKPAVRAEDYFAAKQQEDDHRRRRQLANATSPVIAAFLNTTFCGPTSDLLKLATKTILVCAQRLDVASSAKLVGKLRCMREVSALLDPTVGTQFSQLGACDNQNVAFAQFRKCPAPVNVLTKELFGQDCLNGTAFDCQTTLAQVFGDTCTCANNPDNPQCSESLVPSVVVAAGWGIPLGFFLILGLVLRFVEGCCVSRVGFNDEERAVSFFRVQTPKQDKYFIGLASLAVFGLAALTLGWIVEDPFLVFVNQILQEDIFKQIQWVTTNFDDFIVGWSLAIVFSFAFAGSCYLSMIIYSFLVGRCAWLVTHNAAYLRNGEWFIPSERTVEVWKGNAYKLQWVNRVAMLMIVTAIFAPPIFFTSRTSITVAPPQFDAFQDNTNVNTSSFQQQVQRDVLGNLTSLATSQNALNLIAEGLGFTLMSSFLGFLSSVFLLVIQGAVPAAFATASLALYWTDAVQRQEMETFRANQAVNGILPPPDNSDKDRWRRSLHFFVWCAHASGSFGSLVAAILVYQTLRAPAQWAVIWIASWVVTLPGVFLLARSRDQNGQIRLISGRRRLITAVIYSLAFFAFTVALVTLAPQKVSFASPLAVVFAVAIYLHVFSILISEYCNIGTYTLGNDRHSKRHSLAAMPSAGGNAFEVGYSIPLAGNSKQSRVKSVMAVKKPNGSGSKLPPSAHHSQLLGGRASIPSVTYEERDLDFGSQNPSFGGSSSGADMPPVFMPLKSFSPSAWAPPILPATDPRFPNPVYMMQQQQQRFQEQSMDVSALRKASERVSMRYTPGVPQKSAPPPVPSRVGFEGNFNEELRARISNRLQFRGIDPNVQHEMAERIAMFAANGGAAARAPQPMWKANNYALSPASSMTVSSEADYNNTSFNDKFALDGAGGGIIGGKAGQLLKGAVARTRQSVARWGEDPSPYQRALAGGKVSNDSEKVYCDNKVMDVLLERTEHRENTYGLRVVPFRRLFFIFGLIMLLVLMLDSTAHPISVQSIKQLVFQALISLLSSLDPNHITADLTTALDFQSFDSLTASLNPPLSEYVRLSNISFILLWVVFFLFAVSLGIELYYSRLSGKPLEQKRRGIRWARLVAFAHLPFLFIAVVIPSSADYVSLTLGGLNGVIPACAPNFDNLVFQIASNLFGLAMGGLLAVETMVVLLLIVPSIERALAFVVAREVSDLKGFAESSKTFIVAEKRLKIARLLYRIIPFMSPVLMYIPTILIAQVVAEVYASIMVYVFYGLPLLTSRLSRNRESKDQKPYQWILFSSFWTVLYMLPLGIIGLVEVVKLNQIGFLSNLLFQNPIVFVMILAEVTLAVVIISDVLYLFISSDDEAETDRVIDMYLDAIQEEANNIAPGPTDRSYKNGVSDSAKRVPYLPPGGV